MWFVSLWLLTEPHHQPDEGPPTAQRLEVDLLLALAQKAPPAGDNGELGLPGGRERGANPPKREYKGPESHSWKKAPSG